MFPLSCGKLCRDHSRDEAESKVQEAINADSQGRLQGPIGFPVAPSKFWLMSIFTCSVYILYWGYQNFRHLNVSVNTRLWASVYALFLPLSLYKMLTGLEKTAADFGTAFKINAGKLAASYFVVFVIGKILDMIGMPLAGKFATFLSLIPLYQVQQKINQINSEIVPGQKIDSQFTPWDIAGMALITGWIALHFLAPGLFQ